MAKKNKVWGWICLALWAILILAGVIGKRVFDQPDLVVFFHLPGAIMLVMGWYVLSSNVRRRYAQICREKYAKRVEVRPAS